MKPHDSERELIPPGAREFATTHWSVVIAGAKVNSPESRAALEELCRVYWYSLYTFIRRKGYNPHDAQDLTQGFFARFLEKNYLNDVDRRKGKFRSFLLAACKHFLANEWDRAAAKKRGGGREFISIDAAVAESRYAYEPVDRDTPEKAFDRRWALALLEQVLVRLRNEYRSSNKEHLFDHLKEALTQPSHSIPYAEVAPRVRMSEGALKVAVHRLRKRYRELIRAEIANTVDKEEEIDGELQYLLHALSA